MGDAYGDLTAKSGSDNIVRERTLADGREGGGGCVNPPETKGGRHEHWTPFVDSGAAKISPKL